MKMRRKNILILTVLVLMPLLSQSQNDSVVSHSDGLVISVPSAASTTQAAYPSDSLNRWDFHLSLGSGIMGGSYSSASYLGVTPSLVFRPTDRLKITASATILDSYSLSGGNYYIRGREPRSLAPLRNPARAASVSVAVSYRVNDRLWVAASLHTLGGMLANGALVNPWLAGTPPMDLDATAFSASMRYRMGDNSFLDLHMTLIEDRTGALGPLLFANPYSGFYGPAYGGFCSPFQSATFGGQIF